MTLVETLAVVALLGATVAVTIPTLSIVQEDAKSRLLLAHVLDLDQRARLIARSAGPVSLAVSDSEVQVIDESTEEVLAERAVPAHATARVQVGEAEVGGVLFGADGRAPDYVVEVSVGDQKLRVRISGLTGWTEDLPP